MSEEIRYASLRIVNDRGLVYTALAFICPGCATPYTFPDGTTHTPSGLHLLPVNSPQRSPQWDWDGNLLAPTLSPSILTKIHPYDEMSRPLGICHSFLSAGVFEFLDDCSHEYAGQRISMPPLPESFYS